NRRYARIFFQQLHGCVVAKTLGCWTWCVIEDWLQPIVAHGRDIACQALLASATVDVDVRDVCMSQRDEVLSRNLCAQEVIVRDSKFRRRTCRVDGCEPRAGHHKRRHVVREGSLDNILSNDDAIGAHRQRVRNRVGIGTSGQRINNRKPVSLWGEHFTECLQHVNKPRVGIVINEYRDEIAVLGCKIGSSTIWLVAQLIDGVIDRFRGACAHAGGVAKNQGYKEFRDSCFFGNVIYCGSCSAHLNNSTFGLLTGHSFKYSFIGTLQTLLHITLQELRKPVHTSRGEEISLSKSVIKPTLMKSASLSLALAWLAKPTQRAI